MQAKQGFLSIVCGLSALVQGHCFVLSVATQVMEMLDRLYGKFDKLVKKHGLFKVGSLRYRMCGTGLIVID